MAEEENNEENGQEENNEESGKKEEKKGSGNKLLVVILIFLVLLLAGLGIGGYLLFDKLNSVEGGAEKPKIEVKEEVEEDTNPEEIGHIIDFEQVIVNLNNTKGKKNYLKLKINIELRSEDALELYEERKALIFDSLLTTVSNKTKEELMSIGGKEELKEELKTTFNDMLGKKIIRNIYWRIFVIQ